MCKYELNNISKLIKKTLYSLFSLIILIFGKCITILYQKYSILIQYY